MRSGSDELPHHDSADHLTSVEGAAAYLKAAVEEAGDESAAIAQALGVIACSGNVSELARRAGMG